MKGSDEVIDKNIEISDEGRTNVPSFKVDESYRHGLPGGHGTPVPCPLPRNAPTTSPSLLPFPSIQTTHSSPPSPSTVSPASLPPPSPNPYTLSPSKHSSLSPPFQSNTLLSFYIRSGHVLKARYLFDTIPHKNSSSWNTMLSGYVRSGSYPESLLFFTRSLPLGIQVNGFVLASLMSACERSGRMLEEGLQLHCLSAKFGVIYDVFVATSFVHFYGSYARVADARMFFEEMPLRNVVSWTSLMVGYLNDNDPCEVICLFQAMNHQGVIGTREYFHHGHQLLQSTRR
ncbi:hypothetical protein MLD38_027057 [Melastoma candidum]|uniref:Uncharacterized protein n=1 Tax=Melastoma candidum TaxID=119954 RepID=A0ACB9P104_9MYRT|nr:hypothetical protein MLD38_027057 [Melastoma candidum]